ncbi:SDR family NAD(P)-dependent oxidoreductase [Pseudophaeobacter arcticus]|uniref:SDR family NAD(P)-dependent oxidoreductase n=1 Tax=Pseudophaeobacter arcticus TaxID=385492 RepID=UPI000405B5F6|nr:SDR family NAD(P)-dependent oxidoreductase [Pseudophaeobacter arcticus]
MDKVALIVGAGPGLGASLARTFAQAGYDVALASRRSGSLPELCAEIGAKHYVCDASEVENVKTLFHQVDTDLGPPDLVVYNAGAYMRGPIADLDLDLVRATLSVNGWGALVVAQAAARRMIARGSGTMLFTGASAGLKGFAQSAPFAMGKFALRGLCQSLARELAPKNIHVAHVVLDGVILWPDRGGPYANPDTTLHPDEVARTYLELSRQHKSAWTYEIELRPNVETF